MKKLIKHFSTLNSQLSTAKGFTLIELLIVIAILGILATAVLVAIDPIEQINRGKDAGRINSVDSLGHAVQANYTSQSLSTYPVDSVSWQVTLQTAGEIKNIVGVPLATAGTCPAANMQSSVNPPGNTNICYDSPGAQTDAVVWTVLDAKTNKTKASCAGGTPIAIAVWSSSQGKTGIACVATAATIPPPGITLN